MYPRRRCKSQVRVKKAEKKFTMVMMKISTFEAEKLTTPFFL